MWFHILAIIYWVEYKNSQDGDDCNEIRPGINKTSHYMLDMTRYICSNLCYTTYIVLPFIICYQPCNLPEHFSFS